MMLFCMTKHDHPQCSEDCSDIASSSSTISSNLNQQGRSICSSNHSISISSRPPPATIATTNPDPIMEETPNHKCSECNTPRLMQTTSIRSITYEYDHLIRVPTISYNELVLPGSEIQKEMAVSMKSHILGVNFDDDASIVNTDECVICMEEFTSDNPRYVKSEYFKNDSNLIVIKF